MVVKLIGVKPINFTNNNNEVINGTNIYCVFTEENTQGLCGAKFFLKEGLTLPKDVHLNDSLDLSFDMRGKIEKVEKAK